MGNYCHLPIVVHVASLQELLKVPGDWTDLIRKAKTLGDDVGTIQNLIIENRPQHKKLQAKYGEHLDRFCRQT